jgi:hypothetical protein
MRRQYRGEAVIARRLERVECASGWSWGRRSGEGCAPGSVLPNSEMKLTRLAAGEGSLVCPPESARMGGAKAEPPGSLSRSRWAHRSPRPIDAFSKVAII